MRILLDHFLPMLASIRGICCDNNCLELLAQRFPGTLALAKELDLFDAAPTSIPALLNWLNSAQNVGEHGPRLLKTTAIPITITAIVEAVRKV